MNMAPRPAYARYLAWDSSPQMLQDWEMSLVRSVLRDDLRYLLHAVHDMSLLWSDRPWELDEGRYEEYKRVEKELMSQCRACFRDHLFPATSVGFGASSFAHKLKALLHSFRLEHFQQFSLRQFIDEFVTATQDYGTEKMISRLKPCLLDAINPHFIDVDGATVKTCLGIVRDNLEPQADLDQGLQPRAVSGESQQAALQEDSEIIEEEPVFEEVPLAQDEVEVGGFEEGVFEEPPVFEVVEQPPLPVPDDWEIFEEVPASINLAAADDDSDVFEEPVYKDGYDPNAMLDMGHLLETPPLHHIIHTASQGLGEVMPSWIEHVDLSIQLCRVVRKRSHQPKLLERCFNSPLARHFHGVIRAFKGHIHKERWATLAFSIPSIKKVERGMRLFWDRRRFQGEGTQKEETLNLANDVEKAVKSSFYWAYLEVQEALVVYERKATAFAETCPCHGPMLLRLEGAEGLPDDVRQEP